MIFTCSHSMQHKLFNPMVLLALMFPMTALADQSRQYDDITVFYNSIMSTLIPQEVADIHGIVRAENRALTNISIKQANNPISAQVSGYTTNLLNQTSTLEFVQVQEQTAVYYLASSIVSKNEKLRFNISIQIEGQTEPLQLKFEQSFY